MSEVRRRKIRKDSDGLSDTSCDEDIKAPSIDTDLNTTIDSINLEAADSEYETVDESGSESDDLECTAEDNMQELREVEGHCEDANIILDLERQSGDGQEQDNEKKKVDDDEDRSNPQYIPKRGTFYEHDDRTAEDGEPDGAETTEADSDQDSSLLSEKLSGKTKKIWQQSQDKWSHDRYDEDEQTPKSRSELIAAYGYDIRNEEGPPKARRRHRYGHGPNKYTRNWEDLEAYGKQKVPQRKLKQEDFPALQQLDKSTTPKNNSVESLNHKKTEHANTSKPKQQQQNYHNNQDYANKQSNESRAPRQNKNMKFNKSGRAIDNKERQNSGQQNENLNKNHHNEIKDNIGNCNEQDLKIKRMSPFEKHLANVGSDERRLSNNRTFKNRNTLEFKSQNRNKSSNMQRTNVQHANHPTSNHYEHETYNNAQINPYNTHSSDSEVSNIISQSYSNTKLKNEDNASNRLPEASRSINVSNRNTGNINHRNANIIPPRLQNTEVSRPKRYSSLRQRPLQEAANAQNQAYQQKFYTNEYISAGGNDPNASLANNMHQAHIPPPPLNVMPQTATQVVSANMAVPPPQTIPYVPETVPAQGMTTGNQVLPQQVLAPQYPPSSMQFGSGGPYMTPNNTFLQGYPVASPQHAAPTQYPPQYPSYPAPAAFTTVPNPQAAGPPPMFQPQGGITYYSPQGQPLPPRLAPRRPRSSAIPIVPPPPPTLPQQQDDSPPPSVDNETSDADSTHNIDHILDNMFVQRHPYDPTTADHLCGINMQIQDMTIAEAPPNEVVAVETINVTESKVDMITVSDDVTTDRHSGEVTSDAT